MKRFFVFFFFFSCSCGAGRMQISAAMVVGVAKVFVAARQKKKKKPSQGQSCSYDNCLIVSIYNPAERERPLASQSGGISDGGPPPPLLFQSRRADTQIRSKTCTLALHTNTHTLPFPRRCWSLRIRGLSVSLAPLFSFPAQWNYGIASIVSWRQIQGPFIWDCF